MEGEGGSEQEAMGCAQEMTEERELGAAQEWQDVVVVPVKAAHLLAPQAWWQAARRMGEQHCHPHYLPPVPPEAEAAASQLRVQEEAS